MRFFFFAKNPTKATDASGIHVIRYNKVIIIIIILLLVFIDAFNKLKTAHLTN